MDRKKASKRKKSTNKNINAKDKTGRKYFKHPDETSSGMHTGASAKPVMAIPNVKLTRNFYELPCLALSKALLGQVLVRLLLSGERLSGRIVETEAYLGRADSASHSYKGPTMRNGAMFMLPGTAYVYNIYGIYCCMNISSQGEGACVLLRALEPLENQDTMKVPRSAKRKDGGKGIKMKDLCNGPSKLCQALYIDKASINTEDLVTSKNIWLESGTPVHEEDIVVTTRIGIENAGPESTMCGIASKRKKSTNKNINAKDKTASKYFKNPDGTSSGMHTGASAKPVMAIPNVKLTRNFYELPCLALSKALLGQVLVRLLPSGERLSGRIVETEAYLGRADSASHSYKGPTMRNGAMFMLPGTAYVYNIYGIYCCMNISSQGEGACVLLRALEPLENQDTMKVPRSAKRKDGGKGIKIKDLCNGPSKLCQALNIDKASINTEDLVTSKNIWLESGTPVHEEDIVVTTRIGIENAGAESASKPYRFYVHKNECVSKRDKKAEEKNMQS